MAFYMHGWAYAVVDNLMQKSNIGNREQGTGNRKPGDTFARGGNGGNRERGTRLRPGYGGQAGERAESHGHWNPPQVEDSTGRAGRLWNPPRSKTRLGERAGLKLGTAVARLAGLAQVCLGDAKNGMVRYIREEVVAYEASRRVSLTP